MTSQNSENGVLVWAGVQLTVIREGNFWTSELCRFGGTFGSIETQCRHQRRPKEHFERLQKQSTVNRGTATVGTLRGGRGDRHLSCLGGAQLQTQNTKEINTKLPMTIQTVADDISKSLKFYTFA